MRDPVLVELVDLPQCEPNVSDARVLVIGRNLIVIYEAESIDAEPYAVVWLRECWAYLGGGPNDEAIHNHPLYRFGLSFGGIFEVRNSPWLLERAGIADKDNDAGRMAAGSRHYIFALKEGMLECLARSHEVVGVFESLSGAMNAAFKALQSVAR